MKSTLFASGADVRPDERSHAIYQYSTMSNNMSTAFIHPRLLQVHPPMQPLSPPPTELPPLRPLTGASMLTEGAFLIEDGLFITLWLGRAVSTEFLQQAFGWHTLEGVDASSFRLLPAESTPLAGYLHAVCSLLREPRPGGWLALRVVKQVTVRRVSWSGDQLSRRPDGQMKMVMTVVSLGYSTGRCVACLLARSQGEGDAMVHRALVEDQTRQMMAYSEFVSHCHRFAVARA